VQRSRRDTVFCGELQEAYECMGIWWHVSTPEKRVRGRLLYSLGELVSLSVYGDRDSLQCNSGVILGECGPYQATLTGISYDGHAGNRGGITEFQVNAERLILNRHFEEPNFTFRQLELTISNLEVWLGNSPLDWDAIKYDEHSISAAFSAPASVEIPVPSHGMSVIFDPRLSFGGGIQELSIFYTCNVRLVAQHDQSVLWFERRMAEFAALLSLLMGKAVYPTRIYGWMDATTSDTPFMLCDPGWGGMNSGRAASVRSIPFKAIQKDFCQILAAWFEYADRYRPIWGVLADLLWNPQQFVESHLLSVVQALEGFHRREFRGKYFLRDRLTELVRSIPEDLISTVGRHWIETFPDDIALVRNQLVHCLEADHPISDERLRIRAVVGRWLFTILMLRKIGVPDSVIPMAVRGF